MNTTPPKAIGRTVTVKVSAIQEVCDFVFGFYERQRPRGGDLELVAYQDAMGNLRALQKLFMTDREIFELVNGYIERLTRLFLGEYHPAVSSGPEALSPVSLQSGAAQEVAP